MVAKIDCRENSTGTPRVAKESSNRAMKLNLLLLIFVSPLGWTKIAHFTFKYPFLSSQDMQRIFAQTYNSRLALFLQRVACSL